MITKRIAHSQPQKVFCSVLSDPHYRYGVVGRHLTGCQTVLDIGGYKDCEPWLRGTAPHFDSYTSLNISSAWYGDREFHVAYDGITMPFQNDYFDAVICVDSLEHMPGDMRMPIIEQALKIASKRVVLLFPFWSEENIEFEANYRDFLTIHGLPIKPSILDHYNLVLPRYQPIVKEFARYNPKVSYVSDRKIFGNYTFAQIIIAAVAPDRADKINAIFQTEMEKRLMAEIDGEVNETDAHRVLITFTKNNS